MSEAEVPHGRGCDCQMCQRFSLPMVTSQTLPEFEIPQRVWITRLMAVQFSEQMDSDEIPFVPASALSDVWDEAIKTLMRAADECPVFVYHSARGRDFLIEALEHARDAALSAGKEESDDA